ncbi:IucA/IucC family siderophore biosynthesis protein [Paenibacillus sp. SC116]|uniref:IucA/IucC family protein n=1 Tax=Paenibacillus sp. SC116 TaxID=2968986 RepID=UPI00215A7D73|nr:IucA/IucC family protein [Paenibacillus sp. SC116]MCR8842093.1 IucA/IucC family siderophore biosynthesis protein [Paenibacillus sp. SC116]
MIQASNSSKAETVCFDEVKERIMRQTMEAMLFEGIINVERNNRVWTFTGKDAEGKLVHYSCEADEKWSFGRVKIDKNSIQREGEPCTDIYVFLEEVIQNNLDGALTNQFIGELLETLAKDKQSKVYQADEIPSEDKHYEALESHMADGHPYHPSYKSRIGFSLNENYLYGPEFNQDIALQWIAVSDQLADVAVSKESSLEEMYKLHLTDQDRVRFDQILKEKGSSDKRYIFIPVHPWQMEHRTTSLFIQQLIDKDMVLLGTSNSKYRAQQSIRSMSHRDRTDAPYIKLAMSLINTSTSRILAHHTTQNAPLISDWLHHIIQNDALLQREGFHFLREVVGVSVRYDKLHSIQYRSSYGTLGAVYRENVSTYLEANEEAWPLNAITLIQKNGKSFIQEAIEQHGIEKWSEALIKVVSLPIIHLLYAHGIALESHSQNIILVVENNLPVKIIIKDLHDSVRYMTKHLLHPEWAPQLHPEPETHRKFNRYSFLQAETVAEVRDYTFDAFYFICMTEICFTLEKFGLREEDFWRTCTETILTYQAEHPEHNERFELFNLFSEDGLIEEMTKRRIYGDGELFFRKVKNPLLQAKGILI